MIFKKLNQEEEMRIIEKDIVKVHLPNIWGMTA